MVDLGMPEDTAEARAWATINKIYGGGKKGGSTTNRRTENRTPYKKGGRHSGSQ